MVVNVEAIEAAMALAREELKSDPSIEFVKVTDGDQSMRVNRRGAPRAEVLTKIGKREAVIQAVPVEQGGSKPEEARALRVALIREDCGIQVRIVVFGRPVRITSRGVFTEVQRKGPAKQIEYERFDLARVFGGQKDQKALKAMGVSFR